MPGARFEARRQMESGAAAGPGGRRFPFPYTPYLIQERFMAALYGALEAGRVGIFESPTGTVRQSGGEPPPGRRPQAPVGGGRGRGTGVEGPDPAGKGAVTERVAPVEGQRCR